MSIVDTNKWVPPDTTTFDTVQKLKQNPVHAYRELLMAEDEDGDPEPYYFTSGGAGVYILRIAHGLSRDGHPRIPDVVIPMAVINASKGAAREASSRSPLAPRSVPSKSPTRPM